MANLNIDTFNDILMSALLELIKLIIEKEIYDLLDELEEDGYESEQFTKIKTIKSNAERILEQIEELEEEKEEGI